MTNLFRFEARTLKQWVIPVALIVIVLIIFNVGLYAQLKPQALTGLLSLPFNESFEASSLENWYALGGNWEIRDGKLVQSSPVVEPLGLVAPVSVIGAQPYRLDTTLTMSDAADGGGLLFNLQYPKVRQNSHVARLAREDGEVQLITGYFDPFQEFHAQATVPLNLDADSITDLRLTILAGIETYAVLMNDQVVVRDLPLVYHGGWMGLDTVKGAVSFDGLAASAWFPSEGVQQVSEEMLAGTASAVESTATEYVSTGPPVAVGASMYDSQFDGGLENSGWILIDGDWTTENSSLVQRQPDGYDRRVAHQGPFKNFILRVRFHHLQGSGGGVLFNMPEVSNARGAHLVRYTDMGEGIFWGFFDDTGTFIDQGFAPTPNPGTDEHLLEITSEEATYSVTLDGQTVVQGVPLQTFLGHIGLTTSQSAVSFDEVAVLALGSTEGPGTASTVDLLNLGQISGEWTMEGDTITQGAGEAMDYVVDTGLTGENYTLSVDIQLSDAPDKPDIGGGVLFHVPTADRKEGAHMVRLGSAGKEIFWGYYDSSGAFIGQGGSAVDLAPMPYHTLTVLTNPETYTIQLDGETVATDVPLQQQSGWIGLLSYGGPVAFRNMRLQAGEPSQ